MIIEVNTVVLRTEGNDGENLEVKHENPDSD